MTTRHSIAAHRPWFAASMALLERHLPVLVGLETAAAASFLYSAINVPDLFETYPDETRMQNALALLEYTQLSFVALLLVWALCIAALLVPQLRSGKSVFEAFWQVPRPSSIIALGIAPGALVFALVIGVYVPSLG